jgi:two-component system LytT family sensor kinase
MQFYSNKQELNMKITKLQFNKMLFSLVVLLLISITGFCQTTASRQTLNNQPPFDGRFYYGMPFPGNLGVRFVDNGKTKSEIYEGLQWDNDKQSGNGFRSIIIDGDCAVEFSCLNINKENAGDYRYRVVKNNKEVLAQWIKPSVFIYSPDKKFKYAYLGRFDYVPGQILKVEIYNVESDHMQSAMQIGWRKIKPSKIWGAIQFITSDPRYPKDKLLSVPMDWLKKTKEKNSKDFIETSSLTDIKFRLADSLQNLNFSIGDRQQMKKYEVILSRLYNYGIVLKRDVNGQKDMVNLGETTPLRETSTIFDINSFDLNKRFWNAPGKYKLTFTPKIIKVGDQSSKMIPGLSTTITFTILPAKTRFYQVSDTTLIEVVMATIFRKTATLQLQSIRSRLNPHFIFNALAGIQSLMNKNEVENANKYLSRFARLTRDILDNGQNELTSIEHEINLLTDYLQMEQMRFGFNFNINIDENDIDRQIEIPAMLLQPFVENAVKHGVSSLKEKGLIIINIIKQGNNIVLTVQDNGKGFSENQPSGIGFKLCDDRVKLLASLYKNTIILLRKESGSNGTLITIELHNWV